MTYLYDPDTNTIFDGTTGHAIATLSDDIPRDERHRLGRRLVAALNALTLILEEEPTP